MGIEDIRKVKLEKLENIKAKGIDPYPARTERNIAVRDAFAGFDELSSLEKEVVLAGRIMAKREHGGSTFCVLNDGTGSIQVYFKQDNLGDESYKFFLENFDIGDFIEAKGVLFITKRGEKTLLVSDFKILTKALLPLPEKWHGLSDVEERYRKRYLDVLMNPEVKEKFIKRSVVIKAMREFLDNEGFLEVETPILQNLAGGALAKPFKTHLNALDMDLYLRIAPELYLKRLIVGGYEKVYEIGRCFRNEGMDATHNPDFTMMECYAAYQDYESFMKMTEKMMQFIVKKANNNSLELDYDFNGEKVKINFAGEYPRMEFTELLKKYAGVDYDALSEEELFQKAKELKVDVSKDANKGKIADEIYKDYVRDKIIQPTFIIHHPLELSPLAKQMSNDNPRTQRAEQSSYDDNPRTQRAEQSSYDGKTQVERFQLVVAGIELTNSFSELNDPQEQFTRFSEQEKSGKKGDEEAMKMDEDFIEALEYGMPPTAGLGIGVERLIALLTNSHALREIILFPTMKDKK